MKTLGRLLLLGVVFALLLSDGPGIGYAGGPDWRILPSLPVAPAAPPSPDMATTSAPGRLSLVGLKAVLVVGPIDGPDGARTSREEQNMNLAADALTANGVSVQKFYPPNDIWNQIKTAAQGAHFFFYRGDGGYTSSFPSPDVGGMSLDSGGVTPDMLRSDLHLAPGAIVMLYGCFTAGSSSADYNGIDTFIDIGIAEAQRRVAQYSDPFLDAGAAGYYANWRGAAFQAFVTYLFEGQSLADAYKSYWDFDPSRVVYGTHSYPEHSDKAMWLDNDFDRVPVYDNAFVGLPDRTLEGLFGRSLAVQPSSLGFLLARSSSPQSRSFHVDLPANVGWTATFTPTTPSWATRSPQSGTGPADITVQVDANQVSQPGTYQSGLEIVANDPGVSPGKLTLSLTLAAVDRLHSVSVPLVRK